MGKNTKISYLYRDADNYKVWDECVVSGTLSEEQKQRILDCLYDGEWFLPSEVGLEEERFSEWDELSDHPWFELGEYSFKETDRKPNAGVTAAQLVENFEACKDKWEALAMLEEANLADIVVDDLIDDVIPRVGEAAQDSPGTSPLRGQGISSPVHSRA